VRNKQKCNNIKILAKADELVIIFMLWPITDKWSKILLCLNKLII